MATGNNRDDGVEPPRSTGNGRERNQVAVRENQGQLYKVRRDRSHAGSKARLRWDAPLDPGSLLRVPGDEQSLDYRYG